jgi:hypothetical protein
MNLKDKFFIRIMKSVIAADDNAADILAQDLSDMARNEYIGVLKEANTIMKNLQQEIAELKKQIHDNEILVNTVMEQIPSKEHIVEVLTNFASKFNGELEEILLDLWEGTISNTVAHTKILSFIKAKIDDTKKDIDKYLYEIFTINLPETIDVGQDILNIIKNRLECEQ